MKKHTKKEKLIVCIVVSVLLAVIVGGSITYAWFAANSKAGKVVSGSVLTQYFHCGTGTEDDPFVITRPVHYYNLVYLYQRKEGFCDQNYYFQLGYNLDGDETNGLEFYNYKDDGSIEQGQYTKILNMAYYSEENGGGALLPIGTSVTPFIGTFDGSGLTVQNLTISSKQTIQGKDYKTCDVGVFGYVNGEATVKNVYYDNVTLDLTGADPLAECHGNAAVHDTIPDAENAQDMVFVGYLAGHIKTTSMMEDVYINHCTIKGGTQSDCEFGYFGVVENPETGQMVTALGERVATLRTAGTDAGFGGSMDMKALHTRINNVLGSTQYSGTSRVRAYPAAETITEPSDDTLKPELTITNSTTNITADEGTPYRWQTPTAGSYIGSISSGYTYLYGLKSTQTTQVTVYSQTGELVDAWLLSNKGNYLCTTGTSISHEVTSKGNAKKWIVDANGHWYTYINNTIYYLNRDGTNGVLLQSGIQAQAATVWNRGTDGALSTVVNGITYYLFYNGGRWSLTPFTESYRITDGKGHFLTGTAGSVSNVNSADDSLQWIAENNGSNYTFYTVINGTTYYLGYNNGLTIATNSVTWTKDGDGFYTLIAGEKMYLMYDSGWRAQLINGSKIYSGSHFLNANSTTVSDTSRAQSVNWIFSSETGDTQIYTIAGASKYYLGYNGNLGLSVSTTPITWHRDGANSYYVTQNGVNYYLQYSGGWVALPLNYFNISDGNGNYLQATGVNTFTNTTSADSATKFYFSNTDETPDGTIRYVINNQVCYLGNNNGQLSNSSTTWINDGENRLNASGTYNYLVYQNNTWQIMNFPYEYIISDGNGHYLNGNGTTLSVGTNANNATRWVFSNTNDIDNPSGTIHPNNSNYYLRVNRSGGGCGGGDYTYSLQLSNANTNNEWQITNGCLKSTSAQTNSQYLDYADDEWTVNTAGTTISYTKSQNLNGTEMSILSQMSSKPSVTVEAPSGEIPVISVNGPVEENTDVIFEATQEQMYAGTTSTVRRGTYIPLRTNTDDVPEGETYSGNDAYGVSDKNTGYIIGGAYSAASGSGQGDIRVSRYAISNINGSYSNNNGNFTKLYTFAGTGSPVEINDDIKENFSQLDTVRQKFLTTLRQDNSNVYGLHFMNSAISTNHIIQAEYATILGKSYINYDLPESSIDFNVVERGYITFMAGDYYSGNNAFFSLHQVFRNDDATISNIKEISKVYKNKTDEFAPYVYQYKDGTYSGTYNASDYELKFDTSWITNPTNGNTSFSNNYIYYFEIPCNAGEYALGSVDGKTGAYLLYLDIATNGGAVVDSIISDTGNSDTERLDVEFRTSPDTAEHSILQFSINAPGVTNSEDFSVDVVFDKTDKGTSSVSCKNGCYTINVVNKTGQPVTLYVLLCDDDDNANTPFEYAYKVNYTNESKTNQILKRKVGSSEYDYWKVVAGFDIPSTGEATEVTYRAAG